MTTIRDIPYEDIIIFLESNNKSFLNQNGAYNKARILLKDRKAKGHTIHIIEWMTAHNLLVNKIDIHNFTSDEIDNMFQTKINKLVKLLTLTGNNIDNIKNILRYLHKLDDENIILLPEINDMILNTLYDIEKREKDLLYLIKSGNYRDILNLLKIHHNKQMIRELIVDNVEEIINNFNIKHNNIYFKSLIIGLLNYDELGLVKKFYDYLKILDPHWKDLSFDIINNVYYEFYDDKFENVFKISSSSDLFDFFIEKKKYKYDINDKLKILYIRFLRTAIKLQKLDFIKLIIEYFEKNPLDDIKMINDLKINNQINDLKIKNNFFVLK